MAEGKHVTTLIKYLRWNKISNYVRNRESSIEVITPKIVTHDDGDIQRSVFDLRIEYQTVK